MVCCSWSAHSFVYVQWPWINWPNTQKRPNFHKQCIKHACDTNIQSRSFNPVVRNRRVGPAGHKYSADITITCIWLHVHVYLLSHKWVQCWFVRLFFRQNPQFAHGILSKTISSTAYMHVIIITDIIVNDPLIHSNNFYSPCQNWPLYEAELQIHQSVG